MTDAAAALRRAIETFNPGLAPEPLLALAALLQPDELPEGYLPTSKYQRQPHSGGLLVTNRRLLHVVFVNRPEQPLAPRLRQSYDYSALMSLALISRRNPSGSFTTSSRGTSRTRSTALRRKPRRPFSSPYATTLTSCLSSPRRPRSPAERPAT